MILIGGIFDWREKKDVRENLISMLRTFDRQNIKTPFLWSNACISLGQINTSNAFEPFDQTHPLHCAESGLTVVADAYLTNRKELFRLLDISRDAKSECTDARLIAAAYEKWGENCPEYLLGDFAFAIWDDKSQKLFCCRDHLGVRPFFYSFDNKRFVFASAPKAILASNLIEKRLNRNQLIALAVPEAKPLFFEESWYEKVLSLPSGMSLTIDQQRISKRQYWEPSLAQLPYKTPEETFEALQSLLFEIVGSNLQSNFPIAAHLSGGLDSSAVVSVAARILEKQNKQLQALAVVLPDETNQVLRDERYFINQFRSFPNVKINYITADGQGPFDNVEQLVNDFGSPSITSRHYLYTAFAKTAENLKTRIVLEGFAGEFGLTTYGDGYYAELFAQMHWRELWRELNLRKKLVGEKRRYNLRVNVLNPFVPLSIRNWRKSLRTIEKHPLRAAIAKDLMKEVQPKLRELENVNNLMMPDQRLNQHRSQISFQKGIKGREILPGHENIDVHYPWRDKRLLEFCLAAPPELKIRDGYKRYLVRGSLNQILPAAIQWRNTKEPFSPDYARRYKAQQKPVQNFLEEITPADPIYQIIDVEKLIGWAKLPLADNDKASVTQTIAVAWLPLSIYLIHFLRQFSEFQK